MMHADIDVTNGRFLVAKSGFDKYEFNAVHNWMWAIEHEAVLGIINVSQERKYISLGVSLEHLPMYEGRTITVELDGLEVQTVTTSCRYNISVELGPGEEKTIIFKCDEPFMSAEGDDRQLAFQMCDIVCAPASVYEPSNLIKSIQSCELGLLKQFDMICKKHDINYMMFYGSLLGAVRHRGIIPWDDDIDVAMSREDYEAFVEYARDELPHHYFLQTLFNDDKAFYGGYAKLRDNRTTAIDRSKRQPGSNEGVWIDILPIDKVFCDEERRKQQLQQVIHWQCCLLVKMNGVDILRSFDVDAAEINAILEDTKRTDEFIRHRLYEAFVSAKDEDEYLCSILAQNKPLAKRRFYSKDVFEEYVGIKFENMLVQIPKDFCTLLTQHAGKDYMVYPMIKENKHNNVLWDLNQSYINYE